MILSTAPQEKAKKRKKSSWLKSEMSFSGQTDFPEKIWCYCLCWTLDTIQYIEYNFLNKPGQHLCGIGNKGESIDPVNLQYIDRWKHDSSSYFIFIF